MIINENKEDIKDMKLHTFVIYLLHIVLSKILSISVANCT